MFFAEGSFVEENLVSANKQPDKPCALLDRLSISGTSRCATPGLQSLAYPPLVSTRCPSRRASQKMWLLDGVGRGPDTGNMSPAGAYPIRRPGSSDF